MTRREYDILMDIIDKAGWKEDDYSDRHCELNKDNIDEVRRRRRDQECFHNALTQVRAGIIGRFYDELKD